MLVSFLPPPPTLHPTCRTHQTEAMSAVGSRELVRQMQRLLMLMERLDEEIALLLETDGADFNTR